MRQRRNLVGESRNLLSEQRWCRPGADAATIVDAALAGLQAIYLPASAGLAGDKRAWSMKRSAEHQRARHAGPIYRLHGRDARQALRLWRAVPDQRC